MRIALIGCWHVHATDYLREAQSHPDVESIAVWDDDPARGVALASQYDLPFEPDLERILATPELDGVIVTNPTTHHEPLIRHLLDRRLHVFAEKVLSLSLRGALDLAAASRDAGVVLTVALTQDQSPAVQTMRRLIAEGAIGRVTAVRVRVAHDGALPGPEQPSGWLPPAFLDPAQAGGGTLVDLGSHPLYLCRLLAGTPERLTALATSVAGGRSDDNAVVTFATPSGTLAVAESAFVDGSPGLTIDVRGTSGRLVWNAGDGALAHGKPGEMRGPLSWSEVDLPPEPPTPFARWVDLVRSGAPADPHLDLAIDLSALVEAATRSVARGTTVAMSEIDGWPVWNDGAKKGETR